MPKFGEEIHAWEIMEETLRRQESVTDRMSTSGHCLRDWAWLFGDGKRGHLEFADPDSELPLPLASRILSDPGVCGTLDLTSRSGKPGLFPL